VLIGKSILCFAPDPWDDIWRNRHQIMSLLAQQNKVLYVEPRPYLRPTIRRSLSGEISWADIRAPLVRKVRDGLYIFRPPLYAPLSGREPLRTALDALRKGALRRAMHRLGMEQPIVWLFRPDMADVAGRYDERLLIYHIVDEYVGYEALDAQRQEKIRQRERDLIARADLVLVTSRTLLESKGGINPNTHWVPNAVDYACFRAGVAEEREPTELAGLPHPRIGYVGAINDKIDVELLLHVAKAYPHGAIVLVGPLRPLSTETKQGIETLHSCPNVHFIGRVSVEEVPYFMAACDVGLLPYRRNAWTKHIHPLKMYEYLSCALPIVSTDIPAAHEEEQFIRIAADATGFVSAVSEALSSDSEQLRTERRERASQNTWRHRVQHISELIETTLQDR